MMGSMRLLLSVVALLGLGAMPAAAQTFQPGQQI
jgi:hypothetical protein